MNGRTRFFSRNISVEAIETGPESFLLTGTLTDERLLPYRHYLSGTMRDPGVIHKMVVEMEVSVPELRIMSARARMPSVPNDDCLQISGCVEKILGLSIKRGFTKKVRDLLGETRGCLHLTNLILAMGSAAAQALWAYHGSRKAKEEDRFRDLDPSLLVNSCWLWRPQGPYAEKLGRQKNKRRQGKKGAAKAVIAIDGPAGSGKSTISRILARRLGFTYLDTGAIYRAVALLAREAGVSPDDVNKLTGISAGIKIEFKEDDGNVQVIAKSRDVSKEIRTEETGMLASRVSAVPEVRDALLPVQRSFAEKGGVVCEGRDMGTVVFPDADLKIYLDADVSERARRRHLELASRGVQADIDTILQEIRQRDRQDMERGTAPLKASIDAIVVDTTGLSIQEVTDRILGLAAEVL